MIPPCASLIARYAELQRRYHTRRRIGACLELLDGVLTPEDRRLLEHGSGGATPSTIRSGPAFRDRYEAAARSNLDREIEALIAGGEWAVK